VSEYLHPADNARPLLKLGLVRLRPASADLQQRLRRDRLGLYWLCFGFVLALIGFVLALIGFELALIGFDWLCIGFVFTEFPIGFIFINHCMNRTYVHLSIQQIGFVLHKKS
jgi:hypothetical protein